MTLGRKTRGITFDLDKELESQAYNFSFDLNFSDISRRAVLMLRAVKEQHPDLYDFAESMDWTKFAITYLPVEKRFQEQREKLLKGD